MICILATLLARIDQQRRPLTELQSAERSKMAFSGDFTPVLAKHSKHLNLVDILAVGVDRMQRNFEPMRKQVEALIARPIQAARTILFRLRSLNSSWA